MLFSPQFLRRQQALSLYRDFLRAIRDIESEPQRAETKAWVRGEFEKWKPTTDEVLVLQATPFAERGRAPLIEALLYSIVPRPHPLTRKGVW